MLGSFLYRPHVHQGDSVITPDIVVRTLFISEKGAMDFAGVPIALLTTSTDIQVTEPGFGPNAALVLIGAGGGMLIGIGSDHGREIEPPGDLACAKPLGRAVWRYRDIAGHVENLVLRSFVIAQGVSTLLQEENVGAAISDSNKDVEPGTIVFCVGLVSLDERAGSVFEVELEDPVLNRTIKHRYSVLEI